MLVFAWNGANVGHIAKHGVVQAEAEYVVRNARPPFPEQVGDDKLLVWGRTEAGRMLQVAYILSDDENVDIDSLDPAGVLAVSDGVAKVVYVVHAMDMTDRMKRRNKRRRR